MFKNKKLLTLAVWYVIWWLVASVYNKKNPWELEKQIKKTKKPESKLNVLLDSFIETHKNLLESVKKEPLYKDSKKEILKIYDSYKDQAVSLLNELKVNWKAYISKATKKLDDLYQEKKTEIDSLKNIEPEKVKELKDKLLASYEEFKEKMKSVKK